MEEKYPKIILLVGPSACGKSLFGEYFAKTFPEYERADDRYLVEKYLSDNRLQRIENPKVWDDIMVDLARDLAPGKKYLVEFARGHDLNYLRKFKLLPKDVYPRGIGLFIKSINSSFIGSIGVIHITCNYESRKIRNAWRRNVTGQNLPDSVLKAVFKYDIFDSNYVSKCFNKTIPIVTIKNKQNIHEAQRAKHFKILSRRAMTALV